MPDTRLLPGLMRRAMRMTIGVASLVVTVTCGSCTSSSTTAPSANTFHAEVNDPIGDAVASAGVPKPPDLTRGTVDLSGGNVTFTIQFAAGTMDPANGKISAKRPSIIE